MFWCWSFLPHGFLFSLVAFSHDPRFTAGFLSYWSSAYPTLLSMEKKLEAALADYMERFQEPFMYDDVDYLHTMVCKPIVFEFTLSHW